MFAKDAARPTPPPNGAENVLRWNESRLRRRILYGGHENDVALRINAAVGTERASKWGQPDLTCNLLEAASKALSALYNTRGTVQHSDANTIAKLETCLVESGYWALMPQVQRDTLGIREHLLRPYLNSNGEMRVRRVWADMVEAESSMDNPDQPVLIRELRSRKLGESDIWTWEEIDLRDPTKPVWRVLNEKRDEDLSEHFLETKDGKPAPKGGLVGSAYDFRDASARPEMPYVAYHAESTGELWSPTSWRKAVDATLTISMLWTFFVHGVKNASWPQRWMANGKVLSVDANGRVVVDPGVLLRLVSLKEGQAVQVGHFEPGCDPKSLHEAIASFERRATAGAGLNAADVARVSGDPRSGYALAVTRSGQREAQRHFRPAFGPSDNRLLRVMATLKEIDGSGVELRYGAIPKSLDELRADLEFIERMREQGLMTQRQAVTHMYPEWTKDEVDAHLLNIKNEKQAALAA